MTVRKLLHCGRIKKDKIKIIVSPLKICARRGFNVQSHSFGGLR